MQKIRVAAAAALALVSLGGSAGATGGGTIHVPADSPTIQGGIDLAFDGDTVVVAAGTYAETLFLNQRNNLTVLADGVVTIAPKPSKKDARSALSLSSCVYVTFDGFTISKPSDAGVNVTTCLNVSILNFTVNAAKGNGIQVLGGQDVKIADCTVVKTGKGHAGINVASIPGPVSQRCRVQRCTVSKAGGAGIIVHGPSAVIEDCVVTGTKLAGIELDRAGGSGDGIVRRCTVTSAADVGIVATGHGPLIEGNHVVSAGNYGIDLIQDALGATSDGVLLSNIVEKTKKHDAIRVTASQTTVDSNTVTVAKGDGIRLNGTFCTIRSNTITKAGQYGIELLGSDLEVTGNSATGSKKADFYDHLAGATLSGNTFPTIKN